MIENRNTWVFKVGGLWMKEIGPRVRALTHSTTTNAWVIRCIYDNKRKPHLKLKLSTLFVRCQCLISDSMYLLVTRLVKPPSISQILFVGK